MAWVETILIVFVCLQGIPTSQGCIDRTSTQFCNPECSARCTDADQCPRNCVECKVGYFGRTCNRLCEGHCVNSNCELVRSGRAINCKEGCKDGWSGISCNTKCKETCTSCDRFTGECTGPCKGGYYGESCSKRCPESCSECNSETGECLVCRSKDDCSKAGETEKLLFQGTKMELDYRDKNIVEMKAREYWSNIKKRIGRPSQRSSQLDSLSKINLQ